ncbi:MAG: septum formation initiator family protein [Candidatus Gracilibacteria bacterium]|jgi:cell division protein FtsB
MSYQPYSESQFNITRIILVAGLVMVAYMLYNLTVTVYENYQIDTHIRNFEEKNTTLREENLQKLDDYKYYTSSAYIDKIAKQNLGLVNPGEEVIVLTQSNTETLLAADVALAEQSRSMANWSIPKKWWTFIFDENPFRY